MKADQTYFSEFGEILLFIVGGILLLIVTLTTGRLLRPNRPNPEKLSTYESGEEPVSAAWSQFNIRFYVVALVFLLFEVEIIFLFPWATVFADKRMNTETNGLWGWFAVVEVVIFVVVLFLGLVYAWRKGHLDWVKPEPRPTDFQSKVPRALYGKINEQYSGAKARGK